MSVMTSGEADANASANPRSGRPRRQAIKRHGPMYQPRLSVSSHRRKSTFCVMRVCMSPGTTPLPSHDGICHETHPGSVYIGSPARQTAVGAHLTDSWRTIFPVVFPPKSGSKAQKSAVASVHISWKSLAIDMTQ